MGARGAYSFEDDWSAGFNGYNFGPNFGHEDTPLWYHALAQEAADEWQVPKTKEH